MYRDVCERGGLLPSKYASVLHNGDPRICPPLISTYRAGSPYAATRKSTFYTFIFCWLTTREVETLLPMIGQYCMPLLLSELPGGLAKKRRECFIYPHLLSALHVEEAA